jgi:serine/threonine protein kinase
MDYVLSKIQTVEVHVGDCESDDEEEDDEDFDEQIIIESVLFALYTSGYTFHKRIHVHQNVGVYACEYNKSPVCVKIVCCSEIKRKLPIEARMIQHINENFPTSTHYPTLLDVFTYESELGKANIYIMTLMPDHSFSENIFGNLEQIRKMILQLVMIIHELHSINVIYRDLKISNLLWDTETEQIRICDFDLSTFRTEKKHTAYLGTDGYMSPELLALHSPPVSDDSPAAYDEKIDLYGIGVVLGMCLNEKHETDLSSEDVHEWRKEYRNNPDRSWLETLFLRLTEYNPDNRISLEEILE